MIFDKYSIFDRFWRFDVDGLIGRDEPSLYEFTISIVLISRSSTGIADVLHLHHTKNSPSVFDHSA
jgi:hypothetical protein